jgi:hypothetical protein
MKRPTLGDLGIGGSGDRPDHPADVFQWVFNLDVCLKAFGKMVSAPYLYQSLMDLRTASHSPQSHAHEVRLAWQTLLDVAGPLLTGMFIREGGWSEVCPRRTDWDATPSMIVVWERDGQRVLARLQYQGDEAVGIRFDME